MVYTTGVGLTSRGRLARVLLLAVTLHPLAVWGQEALNYKQITKLDEQGVALASKGNWEEALNVFQRAYQAAVAVAPGDGITASLARNLALSCHHLQRYDDALQYEDQAIQIMRGNPPHAKDLSLKTVLQDAETTAEVAGKYDKAEVYARELATLLAQSAGETSPTALEALDKVGYLLLWQNQFDEAEKVFSQVAKVRKSLPGQPGYSASLVSLARVEQSRSSYPDAIRYLEEALSLDSAAVPKPEKQIVIDLYELAKSYGFDGLTQKALQAETQYAELYAKVYPGERLGLIRSLTDLGEAALRQGEFRHGEEVLQKALRITAELGPEGKGYSSRVKRDLAHCYIERGRYQQGVSLLESLLPEYTLLDERLPIEGDIAWGTAAQGRFGEAERMIRAALQESENIPAGYHPTRRDAIAGWWDVLMMYLAEVLDGTGRKQEAAAWYEKAIAQEKDFSGSRGNRSALRRNAALLYLSLGQPGKADALMQQALEIDRADSGEQSYGFLLSLTEMGHVKRAERQYEDAGQKYRQALGILEKTGDENAPEAMDLFEGMALLEAAQGDVSGADGFFQRAIDNLQHRFRFLFPGMSEHDRLQLLQKMQDDFSLYYSFVLRNPSHPELAERAYDLALWQKGLVVGSMSALRERLEQEADPKVRALWEQLVAKRAQIAALYAAALQGGQNNSQAIGVLETQANVIERELARNYPAAVAADHPTASAVRERLQENEAAVEVLDFREHNGATWTGGSHYIALVLKSGAKPIQIIDLGAAQQFEAQVRDGYRAAIGSEAGTFPGQPKVNSSEIGATRAIWAPLHAATSDVTRLYLAPDGILNTISLAAIPISSDKRLLDVMDITLVSSTRDLLVSGNAKADSVAVLVGDPDFNLAGEKASSAPAQAAAERRSRDQSGGGLGPLPGTEGELKTVGDLMRQHGWKVRTYTGAQAQEGTVKAVQRPRVLHLATHGFFLSEQPSFPGSANNFWEDPMLRSGLFLAGANRTLEGKPPSGEDGILTSSEAADLDLSGTELVVLSACETGLGTVQNGEGVFGLRRALQVAGARSVLMSLWSVPDRETAELMELFYGHWLAGMKKHEALRASQQEMREKVRERYGSDIPFYWAAFVLAGD